MKKVLFTLSCAGGRASNYEPWKKKIDFDLVNFEYPGHWMRWEEKLCDDYRLIAEDYDRKIYDYITDNPGSEVFLAGHSMGALLAWIIAERLIENYNLKGVIVMAMAPPSKVEKLVFRNIGNDNDIFDFLKNIRQVPQKTLSSSFFAENIYPAIKSDFNMFNKMAYDSKYIFNKLNIPCLVMYSKEDPLIDVKDIYDWDNYANMVEYVELDGNHFFPYCSKQLSKVCEEISKFVYRI